MDWRIVPALGIWTWFSLSVRDWYVPALDRGQQMAQHSRANGRYRDAHSRLAQHSEAIISFGGVAAEAARVSNRLEQYLRAARIVMRAKLKDIFAMR